MKPTIGRIVIYKTTEAEQEKMRITPNCNVAEELPAIITEVHSDECVNLKVITDGELDIWVTSAVKGNEPMNWDFPEMVPTAEKIDSKGFITPEFKKDLAAEIGKELITNEFKKNLVAEVTAEVKEIIPDLKAELLTELEKKIPAEVKAEGKK